MIERFTFVKHRLTGQKMLVVDTNVVVARIAVPVQNTNRPEVSDFTLETIEIHLDELEPIQE